jgi:cell wall-associated NlpC family hydrolase
VHPTAPIIDDQKPVRESARSDATHPQRGGAYYLVYGKDDCTNFMSQILHAGGVPMQDWVGGYAIEPWQWWSAKDLGISSPSWDNASSFFHWAVQNGFAENLHAETNWEPGDFVAWRWSGQKNINHVTFVYSVPNGQPSFLQHSPSLQWPTNWPTYMNIIKKKGEYPPWWVHFRFINTEPTP